MFDLSEFDVQTIIIAAPLRWVGLLPADWGLGVAGTHVARTLRFSRFIAAPPTRHAFGAFWAQNIALAEVWRTCVLLTTVFIDWIGPWRPRVQKSALLYTFRVHISETIIITYSKKKLCTPICHVEFLAEVL